MTPSVCMCMRAGSNAGLGVAALTDELVVAEDTAVKLGAVAAGTRTKSRTKSLSGARAVDHGVRVVMEMPQRIVQVQRWEGAVPAATLGGETLAATRKGAGVHARREASRVHTRWGYRQPF